MIRRLPVFVGDPDLIIPKCYTPVIEAHLQMQFTQLFAEGKRFLLQITQPVTVKVAVQSPSVMLQNLKTTLKVHEIYQVQSGETIRDAYFNKHLGYIRTQDKIRVFDVGNHGYTLLKHTMEDVAGEIFIGEKYLYRVYGQKLEIFEEKQGFVPISNIRFSEKAQFKLIGNILVVLDQDYMRLVYLDQVIQHQIHVEQNPVFMLGFDVFNGLIQHVGGMQYVFYHSGKTLSTVKASCILKSVHLVDNIGLAVYEAQQSGETSLRYEYFNLQNLKMNQSGIMIPGMRSFAFKVGASAGKGLVFEANDDILTVRSEETFAVLQEIPCNLLSNETRLFMTRSGIIASEKDFCYLLNSN